MAFLDVALTYDPQARACDLAFGEDGDLVLDDTSVTAMLMSVGLDRRAAADDELPAGRSRFLAPASFSERRGCPGDALDPFGQFTGSRVWLLDRAKQTETTRQLFEFWLKEALDWATSETGRAAEVEAEWRGTGVLVWRVMVDGDSLTLTRQMEA